MANTLELLGNYFNSITGDGTLVEKDVQDLKVIVNEVTKRLDAIQTKTRVATAISVQLAINEAESLLWRLNTIIRELREDEMNQ